jgi:hypothetical protein
VFVLCSFFFATHLRRFIPEHHSRVKKMLAAAALSHSPSSWALLRLLQIMSQCCDVQRFSMAPTIVTGFLACVCTCVVFNLKKGYIGVDKAILNP